MHFPVDYGKIRPMNRVSLDTKKIWLPWLTTRLVFFFFYMGAVTFFLYILGNFQSFSDETQYFIFDLMIFFFYIFFCTAFVGIILASIVTVRRAKTGFLFYLRYVIMVLLLGVLYFAINLIFAFLKTV